MTKSFFSFKSRLVKISLPNFTGMISVKGGLPLISYLKKVVLIGNGSITKAWVVSLYKLSSLIYTLYRRNGVKFVVKYLKVTHVTMCQTLSGFKHLGPKTLGIGIAMTHGGLPRFIPAEHRKMFRLGDIRYIRIWLSLLSLYRVLEYTGEYKLDTIVQPGSMSDTMFGVLKDFVPTFYKMLQDFGFKKSFFGSLIGKPYKLFSRLDGRIFPILKSSPGGVGSYGLIGENLVSTNPVNVLLSAIALYRNKPLMMAYATLAKRFRSKKVFDLAFKIMPFADQYFRNASGTWLGKVGFKVEAAGKVRVFAMVDCWTAWLLQPLHKALFTLLDRIPQDGTHNQHRPVKELIEKCRLTNSTDLYSFDLTAATDRLPIDIQVEILAYVLGRKSADAWKVLLVGRDYLVPKVRGRSLPRTVRYSVGQPMGAYSSWAMLALTHHFLVQFAAYRAGVGKAIWFDRYAVLGDDIVIGDKAVADSYLEVLSFCGMPVNLTKSVVSNNLSCEFAKRYYFKGEDVCSLSLLELCTALVDFQTMQELLRKISGYMEITPVLVLALKGVGYKGRTCWNKLFSTMSIARQKFFLALTLPGSVFEVDSYASWVSQVSFHCYYRIWLTIDSVGFIIPMIERLRLSFIRRLEKVRKPWDIMKIIEQTSIMLSEIPDARLEKLDLRMIRILKDLQNEFNDRYVIQLHILDEFWNEFRDYMEKIGKILLVSKRLAAGPIVDKLMRIMVAFESTFALIPDPEMVRSEEVETVSDSKFLKFARNVRTRLTYIRDEKAKVIGLTTQTTGVNSTSDAQPLSISEINALEQTFIGRFVLRKIYGVSKPSSQFPGELKD